VGANTFKELLCRRSLLPKEIVKKALNSSESRASKVYAYYFRIKLNQNYIIIKNEIMCV
jgi:hypothetical protein